MDYIYQPPPPPPPKKNAGARQRQTRPQPYNLPTNPNGLRSGSGFEDEESSFVPQVDLEAAADVEKWIAERRKNWPSAKRVAEKEQEKERLKRLREENVKPVGEVPTTGAPSAKKPVCKYWLKNKCHNGNKCKFLHQRPSTSSYQKLSRYGAPQQLSLFKRLVQNDMDKENETVLDFVEMLHSRGLL